MQNSLPIFLSFIIALALALTECAAAPMHPLKFIVVVPVTYSNSPALDLMGVASHLQARGHSVLVVTPSEAAFPYLRRAAARHTNNDTAEAMVFAAAAPATASAHIAAAGQQQNTKPGKASKAGASDDLRVPHSWLGQVLLGPKLLVQMLDSMAAQCSILLDDADLVQRLRDFQADAIMPMVLLPTGPQLAIDSCGCVLSDLLGGIPYIEVDAPLATLWLGPPSNPQFGPCLLPADLERTGPWLKNLATWAVTQLLSLRAGAGPPAGKQSYASLRAALQLPPPASYSAVANAVRLALRRQSWRAKTCRAALRILPGSRLLEYPHGLAPDEVLVGPGSPRLPQPLTGAQEVVEFVEGATHGLVLVGFGTGKVSNDSVWLQLVDFQQLARGFASLAPIRVLWNLQAGAGGVVLGANTMVVGWLDFNDVLGHPHTLAFITHCGLHSAMEAAFHGVPVLGLPFMFEQVHTCNKLVSRGAGLICSQAPAFRTGRDRHMHFTHQHISGLVRQLLNTPSYAAAARQLSAALQAYARQRHPYARAADEVEFVLAAAALRHQLKDVGAGDGNSAHFDDSGGGPTRRRGGSVADEL